MIRPKTRYASGDGGAVAYQVVGEGPDLIFVPNWISNIEVMWDEPSYARFLERLASFSRLICFDKRGSGISDAVPYTPTPTLEQWMDDVLLVMDAVGSKRAALLGWDAGGLLSILLSASYPDHVSQLILVDSYAWLLRTDDYPIGVPPRILEAFVTLAGQLREYWEEPGYLALAAPDAYSDPRFREWFGHYLRLSAAPRMGPMIAGSAFQWDLRPVLGSVRAPTLVMSHQNQTYIRPEHGRYVAEHIPGARYVDLEGRDTFIYRSDTDTIVNEIRAFITGVREVVETDRVLATVLFTDIVASTERAAEVGDRRWRELLDAHDALVRARVAEFRGREIKATGDGVLATFDGPARAVRCACALAQDVRGLGIEIKSGLHTGEIEVRGEDIGGIAVHTAARVMAAAGPGEVVVSRTLKDLVAGSGIEFVDRGEHQLKGVPGEWRLYAVMQ